mmetsp:Transcript_18987/g.44260  ORF Transcript_18987/g.44260 Transcript_18987/m.44260 type:complete len:622 (+) Transcript_18987:143-2008(+)
MVGLRLVACALLVPIAAALRPASLDEHADRILATRVNRSKSVSHLQVSSSTKGLDECKAAIKQYFLDDGTGYFTKQDVTDFDKLSKYFGKRLGRPEVSRWSSINARVDQAYLRDSIFAIDLVTKMYEEMFQTHHDITTDLGTFQALLLAFAESFAMADDPILMSDGFLVPITIFERSVVIYETVVESDWKVTGLTQSMERRDIQEVEVARWRRKSATLLAGLALSALKGAWSACFEDFDVVPTFELYDTGDQTWSLDLAFAMAMDSQWGVYNPSKKETLSQITPKRFAHIFSYSSGAHLTYMWDNPTQLYKSQSWYVDRLAEKCKTAVHGHLVSFFSSEAVETFTELKSYMELKIREATHDTDTASLTRIHRSAFAIVALSNYWKSGFTEMTKVTGSNKETLDRMRDAVQKFADSFAVSTYPVVMVGGFLVPLDELLKMITVITEMLDAEPNIKTDGFPYKKLRKFAAFGSMKKVGPQFLLTSAAKTALEALWMDCFGDVKDLEIPGGLFEDPDTKVVIASDQNDDSLLREDSEDMMYELTLAPSEYLAKIFEWSGLDWEWAGLHTGKDIPKGLYDAIDAVKPKPKVHDDLDEIEGMDYKLEYDFSFPTRPFVSRGLFTSR